MRHFIVMCDSNDADYITDIVHVSEEDVEKFMPLIKAIENFIPYPTGLGMCYHNWDGMRPNLHDSYGIKNCYEVYSQFPKEYLDEFFDKFLIGCCPDWAYEPEMINSIHTIHKIQEIILGKELIYADYKKLQSRETLNPKNVEFMKRRAEIQNYKNAEGVPFNTIKFTDMTPEESAMCEEYKILWSKYQ